MFRRKGKYYDEDSSSDKSNMNTRAKIQHKHGIAELNSTVKFGYQ